MDPRTTSLPALLERRGVRIAIKSLLVLLASALSVVFFGLCVPFFLLAMEILPGLGVAGVVYVAIGGVCGLLVGGGSCAYSLARDPRPWTGYVVSYVGVVSALALAYYVAYLNVELLSRHL